MENKAPLSDEQLAALATNPEDLKRLAAAIDKAVRAGVIDYRLLGQSKFSLSNVEVLRDNLELATAYKILRREAEAGVREFTIGKDIRALATDPTDSVDTVAVVCRYTEPDENHEILPARSPGMKAYCKAAIEESTTREK